MLRITVDQDETFCRLKLAGRLCGPWVAEVEQTWRSSPCRGEQIELDVRELTGIDGAGRELLSVMHGAGVHLVVEGVWMKGVVGEIAGNPSIEGTREQSWGKKVPAIQRSGYTGNEK